LKRIMAWKDGVFDFNNASLQEVMRQLERWYDIEVVYEKGVPNIEFVGAMGRDLSLSDVLKGLKLSEVNFRLEGRKLIVMP
jgi:transmembrane sensor